MAKPTPGLVIRGGKKIWIDLDNSPHVPFFAPIMDELRNRGYAVIVTARDCFQVCELATLMNIPHKRIGRHYGKNKFLKLMGLGLRTIQLAPTVFATKPDIAVSHGSRSQLLTSALLGVPSIVIFDYEFVKGLKYMHPDWAMAPEVISQSGFGTKTKIMSYPGIKENVYVPRFKPDPSIMLQFGIGSDDVVVTLRPPATEAHYHNPESEVLLDAVLALLRDAANVRVILLPRNHGQETSIRESWSTLFNSGKMMVPTHAVDGLNLMWYSDLVISGGGTMNREAAALGVPVYSIFRGEIGAVDRYLEAQGRLILLETVGDVVSMIVLKKRPRPASPGLGNNETLMRIVDNIVSALEPKP